jgi:outer membrane protein assembly factor BamB
LFIITPIVAADWPGWLGSNRDGTTTEKIRPWKGELKSLWRVPVGPGHSSPVIAGGKVYLHARVKDKNAEELLAFDAKTGNKLWSTNYARPFFVSPFGTGPQATPIVADGKVYTYGITGILSCFDADKGDKLWRVETDKEFKPPYLVFGRACSPLIEGNNVLINVGGKEASIVAFTKDKGAVAWKSPGVPDEKGVDGPSYSSGIIINQGEKQAVFLTQLGVRGLKVDDGKMAWSFPLKDKLNESSTTPIVAGDMLLVSSITFGMVGLKIHKKDDGSFEAKQVWKNPKLTCYFSTPIPVGKKHVYVVTGTASLKNATSALHCVEIETGKILWTEPKIGKYHAAMLKTGDDKLLLLSDLGDLILFEPNETAYKELSRSKVVKGEQIWAHPAIVEGKVYFRDEKELICLQMPE